MHAAVEREREHKLPARAQLTQHIWELQRKIGNEMLDLKHDQQNENCFYTRCCHQAEYPSLVLGPKSPTTVALRRLTILLAKPREINSTGLRPDLSPVIYGTSPYSTISLM